MLPTERGIIIYSVNWDGVDHEGRNRPPQSVDEMAEAMRAVGENLEDRPIENLPHRFGVVLYPFSLLQRVNSMNASIKTLATFLVTAWAVGLAGFTFAQFAATTQYLRSR